MPELPNILLIPTMLFQHFASDFVFQRREVARNKSKSLRHMAEHLLIIFVFFIPFGVTFSLINAAIHGLIDWNIWRLYGWAVRDEPKDFKYYEDSLFYMTIGFDQFLHVTTLVVLPFYLPL